MAHGEGALSPVPVARLFDDAALDEIEAVAIHQPEAETDVHGLVVDLVREVRRLRGHILDIDAHATPYGDIPDEAGWVGTYLVTAGALHRALGTIGHSAPSCSAEEDLAAVTSVYEAKSLYHTYFGDQLTALASILVQGDEVQVTVGQVRRLLNAVPRPSGLR